MEHTDWKISKELLDISSGFWIASYRGPLDKILVMYKNASLTEVLIKLVK